MRSSFVRPFAFLLLVGCLALAPATLAEEEDDFDEPELDDSAGIELSFGEQIDKAIDNGVKWLLARPTIIQARKVQMAHWGLIKGKRIYGGGEGAGYPHPAGPTALALYTLLKCGVDPKHPIVEKGFNWLQEPHTRQAQYDGPAAPGFTWSYIEPLGSYELSAVILALTAKYDKYKRSQNTKTRRRRGKLKIRDKDDREWLQNLVTALVERRGMPNMAAPQNERLGWRYNLKQFKLSRGRQTVTMGGGGVPPHANQDLSSTQLAALALYAAHQFGAKVPLDVWLDIVQFTLSHQEEDGPKHQRHDPGYHKDGGPPMDRARGFMYIRGSPDGNEGKAIGSMTGCGVVNLLLARDVVLESRKGQKLWRERGFEKRVDTAIWDGLAWLDVNWSPFNNPKHGSYHLYYLYAIERAMDIRGKQLLGKHVWYREGARAILDHQKKTKMKNPLEPRAPEIDCVHWNTQSTHEPEDVLDTCFALLFLKRATKGLVPTITGAGGSPVDNR
jgi:hypothetical protein